MPRSFETQLFDEPAWRDADLAGEYASEVSGAHADLVGQGFNAQVLVGMFEHIPLQFAEPLILREPRGQGKAELRLVSRPLEVHDQSLSDSSGKLLAEVFLDERHGHVYSGQRSRGRVDMAVLDVYGVGVQRHSRITPAEIVARRPVRRGPTPI